MVKGLKNAYLMHFSSLHSWFHCRGCYYLKCSSSLSQSLCKGQIKGQKTFFGQNSFQLMYNHKPKSNAPLRKNHKTADRKGRMGTPKRMKLRKSSKRPLTPPPHFRKIMLRISRQIGDKSAYVHYGGLLCII